MSLTIDSSVSSSSNTRALRYLIPLCSILILFYVMQENKVLFHTLVEGFCILTAFSTSLIAWHSRKYSAQSFLTLIGTTYLCVACLDCLFTLCYPGITILELPRNTTMQIWISSRVVETVGLLLTMIFIQCDKQRGPVLACALIYTVTAVLLFTIFYGSIWPNLIDENNQITRWKQIFEISCSGLLIITLVIFHKHKGCIDPSTSRLINLSLLFTVFSELMFSMNLSSTGFNITLGHFLKFGSFYYLYLAIVENGIERPFALVFHELSNTNLQLEKEIQARKQIERDLELTVSKLEHTLGEVHTLKGILPLCSFCKKVRNKDGTWDPVDEYIHSHSEADISHGVCPDCAKVHYPNYEYPKT